MMAYKVRGEMHQSITEENKQANIDPKVLLSTLLPYGEPSLNAPDVTVEECLRRRKEAKKYITQRRSKLKELLKNYD